MSLMGVAERSGVARADVEGVADSEAASSMDDVKGSSETAGVSSELLSRLGGVAGVFSTSGGVGGSTASVVGFGTSVCSTSSDEADAFISSIMSTFAGSTGEPSSAAGVSGAFGDSVEVAD